MLHIFLPIPGAVVNTATNPPGSPSSPHVWQSSEVSALSRWDKRPRIISTHSSWLAPLFLRSEKRWGEESPSPHRARDLHRYRSRSKTVGGVFGIEICVGETGI